MNSTEIEEDFNIPLNPDQLTSSEKFLFIIKIMLLIPQVDIDLYMIFYLLGYCSKRFQFPKTIVQHKNIFSRLATN